MTRKGFRGVGRAELRDAKIIITGLPFDANCSNLKGTSLFPRRLRELTEICTEYTIDGTSLEKVTLYDNGDVDRFENIESVANEVFKEKGFPIFIGGDHSVAIGTEKAFYQKTNKIGRKAALIHIDAHADIMETYQGNKYSHATPNYHALANGFKKEDLTMIAIRSYEKEEVDFLNMNQDITVYGIEKVWAKGIEKVIDEIAVKYPSSDYDVYLSLDIDSVDPGYAPGTGTPEGFGLTSRELYELIIGLFKKVNIKAMDLVEISPSVDSNDATSWLGIKLLYEVFKVIGGL